MAIELRHVPVLNVARQVLVRRWRVLAAALALPLAATMGLALFLPKSYRATALVAVQHGAGDDDLDARVTALTSENLGRSRLYGLITRFGLDHDARGDGGREPLIDRMEKDIQIEADKQEIGGRSVAVALHVTYTGESPRLAADVANELAAFYEREDLRQREERAQYTRAKLQEQLADAKKRLDEQGARLKDYKMRNLNELPEQVALHLSELAQLNSRIRVGRSEPRPSPQVSAPIREPDKLVYDERLDRLAELRTRYTDQYPEVKQLKREIELNPKTRNRSNEGPDTATAGALAESGAASKATARDDDDRKAAFAELTQKAALHEQGILNAPFRQQELEALLPDYIAARNQYQTLWEKNELARHADPEHDGGRLSVLDVAVERSKAVAPNVLRIVAVGVAVALAAAAAAVLLAERLDSSFHTVEDLRAFTRVPVLATVARLPNSTERRRKARGSRRFAATLLMVLAFALAGSAYVSRGAHTLTTWIHPSNP